MDDSLKNFTIRNASSESKEWFKEYAASIHSNQSQTFDAIISLAKSAQSGVNTEGLQEENARLLEITNKLHKEIAEKAEEITRIQHVYREFSEGNSEVIAGIRTDYEAKIEALEQKVADQVMQIAILKPKGFEFMCSPSADMVKGMTRAISFDIKKGKLSKESGQSLPLVFTLRAIAYYLNQEYSHILK